MREQGPYQGKRFGRDRLLEAANVVGGRGVGGRYIIGRQMLEEDFKLAKEFVHSVAQGDAVVRPVDVDTFEEIGHAEIKHVEDGDGGLFTLVNTAVIRLGQAVRYDVYPPRENLPVRLW